MEEQVKMLQRLGLTEYQSKVFAALLARSESTATELAKISNVLVTKIYSVLKSLEDMGFVKSSLTRPKVYRPVDVQTVVDSIMIKKQERIDEMISHRDSIVNSLGRLYEKHGKKFETPENMVWLFTGAEAGMMEVMKLVKSAKKSVRFLSTRDDILVGSSNMELMNVWAEAVLKRRIKIMEIEPGLTKKEKEWICNTLIKSMKTQKEKLFFIETMKKYFSNYFVREIPKNKDVHFSFFIKDSDAMVLLLNHPLYPITSYALIIYDQNIVSGFLDYFNSLWKVSKSIKTKWLKLYSDIGKNISKK